MWVGVLEVSGRLSVGGCAGCEWAAKCGWVYMCVEVSGRMSVCGGWRVWVSCIAMLTLAINSGMYALT